MSATETVVYVVVMGRFQPTGDVSGLSVTADRVWFQHTSSSDWYLESDCTGGFPNRRAELDAAYPDGWRSQLVDPKGDVGNLPEAIRHHWTGDQRDGDA